MGKFPPSNYLTEQWFRMICVSNVPTVEPQYNDLSYNDIPGITINIHLPSKGYSKMYGAEPGITIFGITIFLF